MKTSARSGSLLGALSRQFGPTIVPAKPSAKYRTVIVGGGSAGVSVASQLLRKLPASERGEVAIVEPADTHFYQPYWTMVGGLGLDVQQSSRPMSKVIPAGAQWVKDYCKSFDPASNSITLASGQQLHYDVLVVAAGLQQNFHLIPGLADTMGKNGVSSIYSFKHAPDVWRHINATTRGTAIFTNPGTAVNCGGAPQKIAYLAESQWRAMGVRSGIDIQYCTATPTIFANPHYAKALEQQMASKGITLSVKMNLVGVDGESRVATFQLENGEVVDKSFDFLHVTPPMGAPDFVSASPLANKAGYVDVDKETLQHSAYPNVFALGDCSSLPTSKTYSAISAEAPVVVHNAMAVLRKKPEEAVGVYDGYTACPVLLGDNKLMLAEFNGYTGEAMPTFPWDQRSGSYLFWFMKRFVFEQAYWHLMPLGRWFGKRTIFEPRIPLKKPSTAAADLQSSAATACTKAKADLLAPVAVPTSTPHNDHIGDQDEGKKLQPEVLGVETPSIPGNVSLAGSLSADSVADLAPRYKGWLYLNPADHPAFHKEVLEKAGCQTKVVPLPLPGKGEYSEEHAAAVLAAMEALPRPLMVQCTSGVRAGAALLLWLARANGKSAESARQLAQDLNLKFYTDCGVCGPVRDWIDQQLPGGKGTSVAVEKDSGYVIEQLFDTQGSSTYTYLLGCKATGEAVLVDPVLGMEDRDLTLLDERGFKLKYILNTHCHADHVTSGKAIQKVRPEVKTMISEASGAKADVLLQDSDCIEFGRYALEAMATPGHTYGCMTYVLRGPTAGSPHGRHAALAVFTGDTLLIRGCGRTDFQQGDSATLYESVHQRIFTLPGTTQIYPGHDYRGRNVSSVEEERRFNPRLTKSRDDFVQLMAELKLPYPKLMDVAVPANLVDGAQS